MNNFIENIAIIIIFYLILVIIFSCYFCNLSKGINILATIIQSLAIIIGGFWTYNKFGWEKKCENIITLKSHLMEYRERHNWAASEYRQDKNIGKYRLSLMNAYNQLQDKIHLSYYVSKKLRTKLFETIWLTIGNGAGKNFEKIDENWARFEKQLEEIYNEFDKIVDF
jgi:hypothetical protein